MGLFEPRVIKMRENTRGKIRTVKQVRNDHACARVPNLTIQGIRRDHSLGPTSARQLYVCTYICYTSYFELNGSLLVFSPTRFFTAAKPDLYVKHDKSKYITDGPHNFRIG